MSRAYIEDVVQNYPKILAENMPDSFNEKLQRYKDHIIPRLNNSLLIAFGVEDWEVTAKNYNLKDGVEH